VDDSGNPSNSNTRSNSYKQPAMIHTQDPEFIKWQFQTKQLIVDIERRLKGEVWDFKEENYMPRLQPMLNEEGISYVIGQVEAHTSPLMQLSNLQDEEIEDMLERFELNLIQHFYSHYRNYHMDYITDMKGLLTMITNIVRASLKRSLGAGAYKGLTLGVQQTETMTERSQQRKGFWQRLGI